MASPPTDRKGFWGHVLEGGRFAIGFIFAASFFWLAYQVGILLQQVDATKLDAQVIVVAIVTGVISSASAVTSFYFASRKEG